MNQNYFGVNLARRFYPLKDNQPFQLPTQTPAIYVFDAIPGRTEAAAGTGAIATITSWTASTVTPFVCAYTIPAIDDPDPASTVYAREYYVAINYILATSEQVQTKIEQLILERADGTSQIPKVSGEDIKAVYPAISSYATDSQMEDFLGMAHEQVQADLRAKGLSWAQILNLSDYKLAVAYKTIGMIALSQIREPNDRMRFRFDTFERWYSQALASVTAIMDTDRNGREDVAIQPSSQWIVTK